MSMQQLQKLLVKLGLLGSPSTVSRQRESRVNECSSALPRKMGVYLNFGKRPSRSQRERYREGLKVVFGRLASWNREAECHDTVGYCSAFWCRVQTVSPAMNATKGAQERPHRTHTRALFLAAHATCDYTFASRALRFSECLEKSFHHWSCLC